MHEHNRRFKAYYASAWACKFGGWTTLLTNSYLAGPQGLARGGSSRLADDAGCVVQRLYLNGEAVNHYFDYSYYALSNYYYHGKAGRRSSPTVRAIQVAPLVEE